MCINAQARLPGLTTLSDYLAYWRSDAKREASALYYLRDWHLARQWPSRRPFYETPDWFCSDWLNEYCEQGRNDDDDYRFVYAGPAGTWTPFHADVLGSYSWSANVAGTKRWTFLPPGREERLRVRRAGMQSGSCLSFTFF